MHFLANDDGEVYFAAVTDWADSADRAPRRRPEPAPSAARRGDPGPQRALRRPLLPVPPRAAGTTPPKASGWAGSASAASSRSSTSLLRGAKDTSYTTVEGRLPGPFRYVITLDSDTAAAPGRGAEARGQAGPPAQPGALRRPDGTGDARVLDPRSLGSPPRCRRRRTPRSSRRSTRPSRASTPTRSPSPTSTRTCSSEGSFAGKGIYDIDALTACPATTASRRTPCSATTCSRATTRAPGWSPTSRWSRSTRPPTRWRPPAAHRWTRGDWQLLPWILRRHEGLSALGLWKMLDNLRRSLSPVAPRASACWWPSPCFRPRRALAWLLLVAASFFLPHLLPLGPARPAPAARASPSAARRGPWRRDVAQGLTLGTLEPRLPQPPGRDDGRRDRRARCGAWS